jgi:hypothetical protein
MKNFGGVRNSAIASQSSPSGHITADKRPRCYAPLPKFAIANFFYPQNVKIELITIVE